jgi:hypothetical protein
MHRGEKGLSYLMGVSTLCLDSICGAGFGGRVEDGGVDVDLILTQFEYVSSSQPPFLGSCSNKAFL